MLSDSQHLPPFLRRRENLRQKGAGGVLAKQIVAVRPVNCLQV
jgi:hypothetical protein